MALSWFILRVHTAKHYSEIFLEEALKTFALQISNIFCEIIFKKIEILQFL